MVRRWTTIAIIMAAAAAWGVAEAQTTAGGVPNILVSRQLRESQHLSIGEVVSLSSDPGGAAPRQFRVLGEYEPVPDPLRLGAVRHEIRMHLPDLLSIAADAADPIDRESVDAINVALAKAADAGRVVRAISAIPGLVIRTSGGDQQRVAPFVVLERFHLAVAIVTVVASSIFLLTLMLMLVDERRSTVGILRLIGFTRRRILLWVLAESVVVAVTGAVVGIVISAAFQGGINRFFQWRYDTALVFVRITPTIALRSIAMAVPLGVAAAVAASWTLLRRDAFSLTRR